MPAHRLLAPYIWMTELQRITEEDLLSNVSVSGRQMWGGGEKASAYSGFAAATCAPSCDCGSGALGVKDAVRTC